MQKNVSEQVHDQLNSMNRTLEDIMGVAFKTYILLDQDATVEAALTQPEQYELIERHDLIQTKFKSIKNSFFLSSPQVYYTLIDFEGNMYTSFTPRQTFDYEKITTTDWYTELLDGAPAYQWEMNDENYIHPDISRTPYLLTLYAVLEDEWNQPYGVARISLDFSQWFETVMKNFPVRQDYFILTNDGDVIVRSDDEIELNIQTLESLKAEQAGQGYFVDEENNNIINFNYIDSLGWYMVNRVPLDVMYSEIEELRTGYFMTFAILTAIFILITLVISTTFIRPLKELQQKMGEVVSNKLKTQLPEQHYRGEALALAQNFNEMVVDLQKLVEQLKLEERQKEAIHFRMLLSQMNPHFLNNTLNTIKWIALRQQNQEIANICISLGKLLETSLNTDLELIHLGEEIEVVRSYVYIQEYRYPKKFSIQYDYNDKRLQHALVPKLSLQILVENAIYHGVSHLEKQGNILVKAYEESQKLIIEVTDDGVGMERSKKLQATKHHSGIGLTNLQERLHLLFKDDASLQFTNLEQGTRFRITLPLLLSTPYKNRGNYYVDSPSR